MTPRHHAMFLALVLGAANARAGQPASVRFANDDVLTGKPLAISGNFLTWESPLLEQAAAFRLDQVLELSLPASPPEQAAAHEALLTLTNGDTIRGQLAAVTDEVVALDTWFAGRIEFKRVMVSDLRIEKRAQWSYRGPTGLDGWRQSAEPPAWSYERGAFRAQASGGIARDGLLHDESTVAFDVAWRGDAIRLKVNLFSNEPASDNPNSGYEISFQRGSVHLRNCATQNFLGSTHVPALLENDRVRVEIRASIKSGKVVLLINGRAVETWSDPDFARGGSGKCLHFVSTSTLPMRVSDIRIAPWDGVLDQSADALPGMMRQFGMFQQPAPPAEEKPADGRMELANGDHLPGEVTSIRDGMIELKTPLGEIKLPAARFRSLALKPVDAERCKRYNGDVRAWFPDGSSIVFRLESCGDGTLTGFSQNFGTATFRLAAFSRLEFNIYAPDYEDRRARDW